MAICWVGWGGEVASVKLKCVAIGGGCGVECRGEMCNNVGKGSWGVLLRCSVKMGYVCRLGNV